MRRESSGQSSGWETDIDSRGDKENEDMYGSGQATYYGKTAPV